MYSLAHIPIGPIVRYSYKLMGGPEASGQQPSLPCKGDNEPLDEMGVRDPEGLPGPSETSMDDIRLALGRILKRLRFQKEEGLLSYDPAYAEKYADISDYK